MRTPATQNGYPLRLLADPLRATRAARPRAWARIAASGLAACCVSLSAAWSRAADAPVRIAVVPFTRTPETLAAAAVVQSVAEGRDGCETVEREAIDAVLGEKALQGGSVAQCAARLNQTLPAACFIFAEALTIGEGRPIRVAAVEARSGALLLTRLLPPVSAPELRSDAETFLTDTLGKLRQLTADGRYVAWLSVGSSVAGGDWDAVSRALTALVETRLTDLPGVALLERGRLQRVGEESFVSGLDQDLRRSVVLLDARLQPVDTEGALVVTLRARWPERGSATNLAVRTHLRQLEAGADLLARGAAALLAVPPPADATPEAKDNELLLLRNRVQTLMEYGSWEAARESAEALYALAPTQQIHRILLFRTLDRVAGDDLDMARRAVELRTRYCEDFDESPSAMAMVPSPFEIGYNAFQYHSHLTTPADSALAREQMRALEKAEERFFLAQLSKGKRYLERYGHPFILISALRTRIAQISGWQTGDPTAQAALLREAVACFKASRALDIRPFEHAVRLLLDTVSADCCKHFGADAKSAVLFQGYLAELAADSNAWCRLAAYRGVFTARCFDLPQVVPDGMPNDQELARRAARAMRQELLQELSDDPYRFAYAQGFVNHPNDLLDMMLLLDFGIPDRLVFMRRYRQSPRLPSLTADVVRLDDLATILERTFAISYERHTLLLNHGSRRKIVDALVETGQEARARRIQGLPPLPAEPSGSVGMPAQPSAPPAAVGKGAWSEYDVVRVGPGYLRRRGALGKTVTGIRHGQDEKWVFMLSDGGVLHLFDVQGWHPEGTPLRVRVLRLQLPECQILEDRIVPLDCEVPEYGAVVVNSVTRGGGKYYLATVRGLLIVDETSFERKWLTARDGLPSDKIAAVAWMDGALYLATSGDFKIGAASLLRYDPATAALTELAAQRTITPRTPLDGKRFHVADMFADPAGKRLLIRVSLKAALDIWSLASGDNRLELVRAAKPYQEILWLPGSRSNGPVSGSPCAYFPSSGAAVALPGSSDGVRIAYDGETVFYLEPWGDAASPRAVHLVRQGQPALRRDRTDDGAPLTHLIGLSATDAGIVLVDAFGGTFLIRRRTR